MASVAADRYNWSAPFVMNPLNHNVMLARLASAFTAARDNGLNYSAVERRPHDQPPARSLVYSTISTLEIAPADTRHYYAGTDDGQGVAHDERRRRAGPTSRPGCRRAG